MFMRNKLFIIGNDEWLDIAHDTAIRINQWTEINQIVLDRTGPYSFDIEMKLSEAVNGAEYFLAMNGDHFGTIRESMLSFMMEKGCSITSLVPKQYLNLFKMKSNCLLHPSATVSSQNSAWGYNVFIGPNACIGANVSIARTVTVSRNSEINSRAIIGKNVSFSSKVVVPYGLEIKPFTSIDCYAQAQTRLCAMNTAYYVSDLFHRPVRFSNNNV
jgi:acetyltransferase-like isoleucine patch superfamily enzyme